MPSLRDQLQPAVDRAIQLHQSGQIAQAEAIYRDVLQRDPSNPDALHLLGLIAHHAGQMARAIELMSAAITQEPGIALYRMNLAKAYRAAGNSNHAVESAQHATELSPGFAPAWIELCACLRTIDRFEEAEHAARAALRLGPDNPDAMCALANALSDREQFDESLKLYQAALRERADWGEALNNFASLLRKLARHEEAEKYFAQAAALEPEVGDPHLNLAFSYLLRGDFARGWAEYEWRWRQIGVHAPTFSQPEWDGQNLRGQTILVFSEQGLGDTIQFIRYAPMIRDLGGRVIVQCEAALAPFIRGVEGVSEVIVKGAPPPTFDVRCAIASLPFKFHTTLATIPNRVPYVQFDADRANRWRDELNLSRECLNVGVVWAGSAVHKNDRNRSCRLADLLPLAQAPGVRWISLQLGAAKMQLSAVNAAWTIEDASNGIADFADSAALVSALDLLITVDSAPAHLAGALGKPVWTLLPLVPDFRWMLDRADSPWYPTMRLFRQQLRGDWQAVAQEVAKALLDFAPQS